jgi:hypothetical protein
LRFFAKRDGAHDRLHVDPDSYSSLTTPFSDYYDRRVAPQSRPSLERHGPLPDPGPDRGVSPRDVYIRFACLFFLARCSSDKRKELGHYDEAPMAECSDKVVNVRADG